MPDDFDFSKPRSNGPAAGKEVPLLTVILIALSVVFTAAFWLAGENKASPFAGISHLGVTEASEIWDGKYTGLILCMFPHINLFHIYFNMSWLWRLGAAIEVEVHPLFYVGFVVASAVLGAGIDLCVSGQTGVGMSGVVYAMFGLMWAGRGSSAVWRSIASRDNLNLMIGWAVLCVVTTYFHIMNVGNGAHIGGFILGVSIGSIWFSPRKRMVYILPLILLVVTAGLGITYAPWLGDWQWWRGNRDYKNHRYEDAIAHYERGVRLMGAEQGLLKNLQSSWYGVYSQAEEKHDSGTMSRALNEATKLDPQIKDAKPEPSTSDSESSDAGSPNSAGGN